MQRMSGSSCNDSSSKSSSSSSVKNVADNVLNSWFFRNPNSNSQSNQNNSGGKFKADMNLWMPQSMWHIKWKKSKQKRTKKERLQLFKLFSLCKLKPFIYFYTPSCLIYHTCVQNRFFNFFTLTHDDYCAPWLIVLLSYTLYSLVRKYVDVS
jgi:hypothetical protein